MVRPRSSPVRLGVLASGRGSNFAALADAARGGRLGGGTIDVLIADRADAGALVEAERRRIEAVHLDPGSRRARLSPESESAYVQALRDRGVEVVLLAGFLRILDSSFLSAYPMAVLNIHPSLLPAFPGLDSVARAFAHGVTCTGCTVHLVDGTLDNGPILAQQAVEILPNDTAETVMAKVHRAEHALYPETVRRFLTEPFHLEGRRVVWEGE